MRKSRPALSGRGCDVRPILFSGAMVRALLGGHKTQTRRVIATQPPEELTPEELNLARNQNGLWHWTNGMQWQFWPGGPDHPERDMPCPFGVEGGLLWVKETYRIESDATRVFRADGEFLPGHTQRGLRWIPSIYMARKDSRITLRVMRVRAERLQDISELDALAEGVRSPISHRAAFADLWDSINAERGKAWAENPWVWVIEFQVIHANVDHVLQMMASS